MESKLEYESDSDSQEDQEPGFDSQDRTIIKGFLARMQKLDSEIKASVAAGRLPETLK